MNHFTPSVLSKTQRLKCVPVCHTELKFAGVQEEGVLVTPFSPFSLRLNNPRYFFHCSLKIWKFNCILLQDTGLNNLFKAINFVQRCKILSV